MGKQIDWMVKHAELDPDRQRQIIRKTRPCESTGRGPGVQTLQFEVYRRQKDMWYEFKDLQRCVVEWQRKNPRTMLREDPREEVLKIRVRNIMDLASAQMNSRRAMGNKQRNIGYILLVIQIINALMSGLMFFVAYYRYRKTPREILFSFIFSSQQFICGVAYLVALVVAYAIAQRRHADSMEQRYQRLIYSCERLTEQISDFRVETEELRLLKAEADTAQLVKAGQPPPKEKRVKKRRKKRLDAGLAAWCPDYDKTDPEEHAMLITKAIEESYKFLPSLPDNFRPNGGDRMMKHAHRLGGLDEENMVLVSRGRGADKFEEELLRLQAGFNLPSLPGPPSSRSEQSALAFSLPPQPPLIPPLSPPIGFGQEAQEADDPPTARMDTPPRVQADYAPPPTPPHVQADVASPATPPGEPDHQPEGLQRELTLHRWMPGYVAAPDSPEAVVGPDPQQRGTPPQTPPLDGHRS